MSQNLNIVKGNVSIGQANEFCIINNPTKSLNERVALLRSMTDRLQLSLDDVKNSNKLNSLSIIPSDLLPFDVNLIGGQKITVLETNPVVTLFDGELTNAKGNIIRLYLRKEGEELPEDYLPHKKMFTVDSQTLEKVLPSIINDVVFSCSQENNFMTMPGTSKNIQNQSNHTTQDSLLCKNLEKKIDQTNNNKLISGKLCTISNKIGKDSEEINISLKNDSKDPSSSSAQDLSGEFKVYNQPGELHVFQAKSPNAQCKQLFVDPEKDNSIGNDLSPFSSKFQVIGLVDTGVSRDSESDEELHNIAEDDWIQRKDSDSTIFNEKLINPCQSDFKSQHLRTPSPVLKKQTINLRKSARTRKPKIRSPFKCWDDIKIKIPRHVSKSRSKGISVTNKNRKIKRSVKRKNVASEK